MSVINNVLKLIDVIVEFCKCFIVKEWIVNDLLFVVEN